MIKTKKDLRYYRKCDEIANSIQRMNIRHFLFNDTYKFLKNLRKAEYYKNNKDKSIIKYFAYLFYAFKVNKLRIKFGWGIPLNSFGPGLSIPHYGPIIVNPNAKIGCNCRIHVGTNIGTAAGTIDKTPKIGDNVYIGPGAKLYGDIYIGNDIAIGANSVVNKCFNIDNVSIAGIPAKIISNRGSEGSLIKATEILEKEDVNYGN